MCYLLFTDMNRLCLVRKLIAGSNSIGLSAIYLSPKRLATMAKCVCISMNEKYSPMQRLGPAEKGMQHIRRQKDICAGSAVADYDSVPQQPCYSLNAHTFDVVGFPNSYRACTVPLARAEDL